MHLLLHLLRLFVCQGWPQSGSRKSKVSSLYAHEALRERPLEGFSEGRGLII